MERPVLYWLVSKQSDAELRVGIGYRLRCFDGSTCVLGAGDNEEHSTLMRDIWKIAAHQTFNSDRPLRRRDDALGQV